MADYIHNMTASTSPTSPGHPSETAVLEAFIPGYSLLSHFLSSYFRIDLSYYLPFLVALTALTASLKFGADALTRTFEEYFVSTAEIRLDDEMYNYLMFWMSQQRFSKRTPRFVAGTKTNSDIVWESDDDGDRDSHGDGDDDDDLEDGDGNDAEDFEEFWARAIRRDKYKKLRFTPAVGRHWFRYKGRLIAFTREQDERRGVSWILNAETLYLSCMGRNPSILKELLREAQRSYVEQDGNKTVIYRGQKNGSAAFDWVRCMARPPRPLSTVVLDREQKEAFIDDIKEYLHPRTRRWYANRGIPYRRGYLLHGPPGTGKTSLCFAAAGLLGLKIYLLSLNSKSLDEDGLSSLFQSLPRRCIVLLEDVDSAGVTQKRSQQHNVANDTDAPKVIEGKADDAQGTPPSKEANKPPEGISLSSLLNVIDGVAASEGRILVMTTNHLEKLDPALLRPGRVDMSIAFDYSSTESIRELFRSIYSTFNDDMAPLRAEGQNGHAVDAKPKHKAPPLAAASLDGGIDILAAEFASRVPGGEFTAAEVQGYLLKNKNEPKAAIDGAEAWVQSMREKRREKEEKKVENPSAASE